MGIAWSRNSKSYRHIKNTYKTERLDKFTQINAEHSLQLPYEWLEREAEAYARYKADSEVFLFSELDPFSMVMFAVSAILTAVLTIAAPPAGWLAWTYFGINVALQAGALALTMTQQGFLDQLATFQALELQNTQLQTSLTKHAMQKQSGQLSDFLIFNPYAICATGSVYKSGAAGSESYTSTAAYDPTQGLRGDFALSPFDEQVQNRAQKTLAGGESFESVQNPLPIPRAKATLSHTMEQDGIKTQIKAANEEINGGYMKLSKEDFGYFEQGEHIESYYKHSYKKRIEPLKNRYRQNDFLEKQKNYAKGLRADFFYETLREKKLTPEQRQKILAETLKYYQEKLNATAHDKILQGAIFLDLACSFVESFYKMYSECESLDFRRDYKNPFGALHRAESFLYGGGSGVLQDGSLKKIKLPYFITRKGIPENAADYRNEQFTIQEVAQRTHKTYFRDEEIVKNKLKLDFYSILWRDILKEFDFIASHLIVREKLPENFNINLPVKLIKTYHFIIPKTQKAYWRVFIGFLDDKFFNYHISYEIDTQNSELFLRLRERKPQLTDAEWERAFKVYTGFF